jgi:hypothetical protein
VYENSFFFLWRHFYDLKIFIQKTYLLITLCLAIYIKMKSINPQVSKTENTLDIRMTESSIRTAVLFLIVSITLAYYTTTSVEYFIMFLFVYMIFAYTFIDDAYTLSIDKSKGEIRITKSKIGRTHYIRVSLCEELIDTAVSVETISKKECYRLELEFMSPHGYYKIPTISRVTGAVNKAKLEDIAKVVREFMNLKPLPGTFC